MVLLVVVVGNETTTTSKSRLSSFENTMGETCEHPTTRRGGREWESDPDSDPELVESDRPPLVCVCVPVSPFARSLLPPRHCLAPKPLNSRRRSLFIQFCRMKGPWRKVLQFSREFTRRALHSGGAPARGPCERSIQITARLVRTRFRIGRKIREEVDTFLHAGKGGQGNACKGMGSL